MAQALVVGIGDAPDAVSWRRAHEELVRLARKRAGLDFEEGRWLLRALHSGSHVELGYGSFYEYTERLFGYGLRLTQEKLRVAEALAELPDMAEAFEAGSLSFSAVRELTRVAIPSTERAWLEAMRGRTVREIEQLVAGHRPGSLPADLPDAGAKRHVLRFEVSGEALATFREAMAKIRREAGEALDEEATLLLMSRQVLEGPRDEGRSSFQVALTVCEHCRRGKQRGRGELVEVSREVVAMAECDGQHIGRVQTSNDAPAHVGADGEPAHVVADTPRTRAKQSVPPALRREVLHRDGGRCRVLGCHHATFVDVHHLRPRAEGGVNTRENLVTLCCAHHTAIHAGKLFIVEATSGELTFLHADGTAYGQPLTATSVDVRARAYRALIKLGFRESETKHALARTPLPPNTTLEPLLRQALRDLTPSPL
ncbi:MAG TPA: HNH endonuclease [Polyangiaceae bacterium]|jgi:hypothetical protein|nr:HNH endonuclease [Polyangiaceae bacterium]